MSESAPRILLVDDDVEMLKFADYCLSNAGYRTILAADRAEALRRLAGPDEIALLFTDVLLGADETGTALAESKASCLVWLSAMLVGRSKL